MYYADDPAPDPLRIWHPNDPAPDPLRIWPYVRASIAQLEQFLLHYDT